MSQNQIKEQIKYLTEVYKSAILLTIAIGGGVVSLFIRESKTDPEMIVLYFGVGLFIAIFGLTFSTHSDIKSLIKKIS